MNKHIYIHTRKRLLVRVYVCARVYKRDIEIEDCACVPQCLKTHYNLTIFVFYSIFISKFFARMELRWTNGQTENIPTIFSAEIKFIMTA